MAGASVQPELSIVVPVFNEAECIESLHGGLTAALTGFHYEIVVVDDGSTDTSAREIAKYPAMRYVRIPHAGKSAALGAGIEAATADTIVTIDADLQEDPMTIRHLLAALREGADLACGVRTPRVDGLWRKRIPSRIYRSYLRVLFGRDFKDINCGLRAARREIWEQIPWFEGAHRLVPAMVTLAGGDLVEIPVPHRRRTHGQAKFDSPSRFLEGIRDALVVRIGSIPQSAALRAHRRAIG